MAVQGVFGTPERLTVASEKEKPIWISETNFPIRLCSASRVCRRRWVDGDGGGRVDVTDPASGHVVGTIPDMGANETRRAIEAANVAWPAWRAKTAKDRSAILRKWFELMMENQRDLGIIMTAEQGKPLTEAMGEVAYGASYVEFYAEEAKRIYGDIIPNTVDGKRIVVLKQPVGVVGSITLEFPERDDYPQGGSGRAAGCTFVAKRQK